MKSAAFFLAAFICLPASLALAATMPAVEMKVVDEQDGKPVAGAHVLFQARGHEGTFTGHGGREAILFAMETVTDEKGGLQFPKTKFSAHPFFLNTNYENPTMVILKEGYQLLVLRNESLIIPRLQEMTVWERDHQTVKMKRIKDGDNIQFFLSEAQRFASLPETGKKFCIWKDIPRFLVALDRWDVKVNPPKPDYSGRIEEATMKDPSGVGRFMTPNPLRRLFVAEAYYVEKGCGSPKVFFEPYLR